MNRAGRPPRPLADRFWEKVDRSGECWVWQSTRFPNGYGQIKVGGKTKHAHRISYEMAYGPIPADTLVCHHCDNPPCVRPDHLFLGSHADNHADRNAKGRQASGARNGTHTRPDRVARGSRHGWAQHPDALALRPMPTRKLTREQAAEIRRRFQAGERSYKRMAEAYGVSDTAIYNIIVGKTYL